jgi:hypothetical protein
MSLSIILQDWSAYDDRKKEGESNVFSCEDNWEVEYLIERIISVHPTKNRLQVQLAINSCCYWIQAPRQRSQFIECVLRRLELPI